LNKWLNLNYIYSNLEIKKNKNMELTRGQKLVGIRFNPSELTEVDIIKQKFADTIDMMYEIIDTSDNEQKIEFAKDSIKQIIQAQMLTVKAITWS
jgi:hypothetical protein